jgi:hypothetical protein
MLPSFCSVAYEIGAGCSALSRHAAKDREGRKRFTRQREVAPVWSEKWISSVNIDSTMIADARGGRAPTFSPLLIGRIRRSFDYTQGRWMYLFRAVDNRGDTVDFYLSETRDRDAAKRFLQGALANPDVLVTETTGLSQIMIRRVASLGRGRADRVSRSGATVIAAKDNTQSPLTIYGAWIELRRRKAAGWGHRRGESGDIDNASLGWRLD